MILVALVPPGLINLCGFELLVLVLRTSLLTSYICNFYIQPMSFILSYGKTKNRAVHRRSLGLPLRGSLSIGLSTKHKTSSSKYELKPPRGQYKLYKHILPDQKGKAHIFAPFGRQSFPKEAARRAVQASTLRHKLKSRTNTNLIIRYLFVDHVKIYEPFFIFDLYSSLHIVEVWAPAQRKRML